MPLRGSNSLDFERAGLAVSRGGQQNFSFFHHDGANSSPVTQVGKLSPYRLQGTKTHTPELQKRREAETGKRRREGEMGE